MKTLRLTSAFTPSYPLAEIAPLEKILFFDIETTGFSPNSAYLYLIGCLYYESASASWQLLQWFCEGPEDEPLLLSTFSAFLSNYTALIHYNGNAFDLPFIRSRCQIHGLDCPLSDITSIDLYQKIRPWKTALSLSSLKQKNMEQFLGICRTIPYTGRQLIAAYQDYLSTRKTALFHMLLMHNQEDLQGLLQLLTLLNYTELPKMQVSLIRHSVAEKDKTISLNLLYQSPCTFPAPFYLDSPFSSIEGQGMQILCRLPMYKGELKYFYPDYKNYYYLPCEDMAIHKSVGNYVAKEARKKAAPQTCYTKKNGLFFPQPALLWQPAFQFSYQSRPYYVEYRDELFSHSSMADAFFHQLFPVS